MAVLLATAMAALSSDVLLKVSIAQLDAARMEAWLLRRPFAAVLPLQPLLVRPISPQPPAGIDLTFRRKPSHSKGGTDGGLRYALVAGEAAEGGAGMLLVSRISEGQAVRKSFSERALLTRLLADLETLPDECGKVCATLNLLE
ncbi:hypothetical protein AB1Y20_013766 [Prymnesium parvum]|uniref:Uncharacterized protein n=1 Tax=Prymnesium parvum TaxID=97485 RepID=A0AB34IG14_PRYPA